MAKTLLRGSVNRRHFLTSASTCLGLGLLGASSRLSAAEGVRQLTESPPLSDFPLVRAQADRLVRTTVCLRPFRAMGPNLSQETIGDKTVIHNYGHGGSGWSLSWGSGQIAVDQALATGAKEFAVIGCGAMGLTSAILLQRAGMKVTIYAKKRPPEVFSSYATGVWSPDSRIALKDAETPQFQQQWEAMTRTSHRAFQNLLGLPHHPVEWFDRYTVSDIPTEEFTKRRDSEDGLKFSKLQSQVKGLMPLPEDLPPWKNAFAAPYVRRTTTMLFNLTAYMEHLLESFFAEGGRIVIREFQEPGEFKSLPEKTLIHATGYGAKALFKDESITPVRGQLSALIPQEEVRYGIVAEGISMVPRRDGIIVQASQKTDFGSTDLTPHREETEKALAALANVYARMRA